MKITEFIDKVKESAGWEDQHKAEKISKAVLGTLGELLSASGRHHLDAQLPKEIKEYVHAWDHTLQAEKMVAGIMDEKIINRIQARAELNHTETTQGISAVLTALRQAISAGELEELEGLLHRLEAFTGEGE